MPSASPPVDRTFDSPNRDFDPITEKFPFVDEIQEGFDRGGTLQTSPSGEYFKLVDFTDHFNYRQSLVGGVPSTRLPSELYGPFENQSFGEYFSALVVGVVQDS